MKRGYYILFLLTLLLPIISAGTSQETGVSVTVISDVSVLEIISPTATTYQEDDYILLNYTATLIDTIWYNLDEGSNTTINSSLYFQTSPGTHTLYLYGNQSNGTILSDSVTFNVETVETVSVGGGRKTVRIEKEIPITLEKERIEETLTQGESKLIKFLVENNYNEKVKVNIKSSGLENILKEISQTEFYLEVGESKEITLNITATEDLTPDLYLGGLTVETETTTKEIILAIEVESLEPLFDVKVEIPKTPTIYQPGEDLTAIIDFFNLGKAREVDVNIEYEIKNEEDEIVFGEKQTLIIGKTVRLTKSFKLPENIEEGSYVFYIKISYDNKTASASKWFTVKAPKLIPKIKLQELIDKHGKIIAQIITSIITTCIVLTFIKRYWLGKRRKYKASKRRKRR